MEDQLIEAWRTNHRINLMLIDTIKTEGWTSTLSVRGGRGVAGEFAHMHNVRLYHLEKRTKDLADGLEKFPTKFVPTKAQLKKAMTASTKRIETLLVGVLNDEPGRRGFKKGIFTTLAYFISHEAHHRGRILLTLKVSGHTLANPMQIWDWDRN
jgi:uncharacterized damage-inducible protein DinB